MSRRDVAKRHDFRSAMKSKEKLSSMKSVRFDSIYNGKEAEVGHGGAGCPYIYIYVCVCVLAGCMCASAYIYIYVHTCIHTYTDTYIHKKHTIHTHLKQPRILNRPKP